MFGVLNIVGLTAVSRRYLVLDDLLKPLIDLIHLFASFASF